MATRVWQLPGTLEHAKREALLSALQTCDYHMIRTAAHLRVSRSTLYRLKDIYEIDAPGSLHQDC